MTVPYFTFKGTGFVTQRGVSVAEQRVIRDGLSAVRRGGG